MTELTHLQEPAAEALTQLPASRQQPEEMHGVSSRGGGTLTPERGGCGAGSWSGNTDPSLPQASPCVSYTFFPQNFVSHSENPEGAESKTAAQTRETGAAHTPYWDTRVQYARCRGLGRLTPQKAEAPSRAPKMLGKAQGSRPGPSASAEMPRGPCFLLQVGR